MDGVLFHMTWECKMVLTSRHFDSVRSLSLLSNEKPNNFKRPKAATDLRRLRRWAQ
jgi:hypothetical protein